MTGVSPAAGTVDTAPAAHYDRVTDAWGLLLGADLHYGVFEGDEPLPVATHRLTTEMAAAAAFRAGDRFLDIGCGTGNSTRWVAAEYGVDAVGISTSRRGVERAAERVRGQAGAPVFEVRDGMRTGFPDRSFDRVWALESSHLMPDRGALVRECARVLRPGGRFALCDIVLTEPVPFRLLRALRAEFALLHRVFGAARMETVDTYAQLAAAAGFEVDSRRDISAAVRPTFARWAANAETHRAEVTASIGAAAHREFAQSCDILERMWDRGILGYGILAAVRGAGA
ncbi:SAM-dependent methyltransferase [Nocardia sp. NPDC057353]|uniref:SAM-dependent methyltransferase n=1 Tax=Nocardia sp. NPDC057353 TaxID=3346104 RepID=UPI003624BB29